MRNENFAHHNQELDILVLRRLEQLTSAVTYLAQLSGARLTRAQLMERFEVSRSTLTKLERDPTFPKSIKGKWCISDILEWERSK